jgi:nucleoside-diphosphate-sugar epimerase
MPSDIFRDSFLKVLVTGATGFIGSHLVFSLLENNYTIAILKREKSKLKTLAPIRDKIRICISDTYNSIFSSIKDFKPDIVIHAASLIIYKPEREEIIDIIDSNIKFGTLVLEAMTKNRVKYFLNIGTRWQHIGNKRYCPANLYAATKEAFKDILIWYESKGIKHKTIELCDTFGNEDTRKKILNLLITSCRSKTKIDLTFGEQILDMSYIGDICRFILSHITYDLFFDNKTISLSGTKIKLRDLGVMIEKMFKTHGLFKWGVKPYRENEVMIPPIYYHNIQLSQQSLKKYLENITKMPL